MKSFVKTHVFNFRLFVEGLKRLKVAIAGTAIFSVTLSALIPIIFWIEEHKTFLRRGENPPSNVPYYSLVLPIYVVVFIAPFLMLKIFSYLHKRKESDFFHAIPYTRSCVYVSFTLSALTAILGILLLSCVTAGMLWGLCPYAQFNILDLIVQLLVCMLAASMLCSIMSTAVMLTGTGGVAVGLFALFCGLWRYILYLFEESINFYVICTDAMPYLDWDWFLPFRLFVGTLESYQTYGDRFSLSQIIYSIIVTLVLFIVAGILYQKRQSEMAGNVAPNRTMQHVYRCLFTLPVLMLMPYFVLCDNEFDFVTNFIIIVVSLLIYYLYELITTKSFKGFLKATPWLGGLAVAVILFFGAHSVLKQVILYEDIDADEIEWVQIQDSSKIFDGYQLSLLCDDIQNTCDDEDVIAFVADALQESQIVGRTNDLSNYMIFENSAMILSDENIMTTKIKLKSGRVITRNIIYHDKAVREILADYADDISTTDIMTIPDLSYLEQITVYPLMTHGKATSCQMLARKTYVAEFMSTFLREYETLSDAEKMVLRQGSGNDRSFSMSVKQIVHKVEFRYYVVSYEPMTHQVSLGFDMFITKDYLPQTYNLILSFLENDQDEEDYKPATEEVTEK